MQSGSEETIARDTEAVLRTVDPNRHEIWSYYRLAGEAADGYPLVQTDSGPTAHPIHGTYMAIDLMTYGHKSGNETAALDAAERLLFASAKRMADDGQTLRFMYHASSGLTPYPHDFYSALTQAHYLNAFGRLLEQRPNPRVHDILRRVFQSMLVPVSDGGVLNDVNGVISFEEYPSAMPSYVLNGWLTVLSELYEYGFVAKNDEAIDLVKASTRSLAALLERYDMPEVWSSRYSLTGNVTHKIFFKGSVPSVEEVVVSHGGEEARVDAKDALAYSLAHIVAAPSLDNPALTLKAAASLVRYPEPSRVSIRLRSPAGCRAVWKIGVPQYDPEHVTPRGVGQRTLATVAVEPGESWISQEVPLDLVMGWAGSPTAFSKELAGKRYNVYHYLHVKALTQLHEFTDLPALAVWRDRWLGYTKKWPDFPLYGAENLSHGVYSQFPHKDAETYLRDPRIKIRGGKIERWIRQKPRHAYQES
ncbi:D-glucuronyl C5-epimerase family protein [Acidimicrobiales bacterium]|nr:D-glucuronyl C5-epimerase family protein [Acidimicrobiales bacterium]